MSITDELREYVQSWRETPNLMDDLDAGDIDGLLGDFEHIDDRIDAHVFAYRHGEKIPYLYLGKRCKVCGRLYDFWKVNQSEPPEGVPLYEVPDWLYLWDAKVLPEEMRVKND